MKKIKKFHEWIIKFRDPKKTGLVSILHPWESGYDNSPLWDDPMNKVKIDKLYTMLELLFLNTPRINNDINDREINISDVIKFIFSINFYPQNRCLNLHYMSELNCL